MVVPYMLEDWQREDDIVTIDDHYVVKAVGKYVLKQTLGKGSMGKVKLGIHIVTGEKAAIKIVPRTNRNRKLTPKELSRELRAIREGHLMMLLNHPHIVYLRDMVAGSHYYYFLMDYVSGGQLLHYIVKRSHLSEKHARHFCRQMVSALDYMHRNSVVHRDLKIENILVDRTGRNIKIIDFGLSNLFCPERQLTTYCGSLYFAAPELLNGRPYRGPEIDVWSMGVVLYVMVTGSVPFDDKSLPGLHEKIKRAQVAYPAHVSTQCHHLLSCILIAEPQQRITLADIIRHPWLNEGRSGHTRNYMLYREPLSLPLDDNVLGRMTFGFNLGTVDDIRMKMEVILQSSVYRVSAAHVSDIQSLAFANQKCDKSSSTSISPQPQHQLTNTNQDKLKSINRAANHLIWGTYNDPQTVPAAYHPLLSIYYLTMERMKRMESLASGKSTLVSSTNTGNLSIQKPVLRKLDKTTLSSSCVESSINLRSKQLAPIQQPNHHRRHQSHSEHETSEIGSKKDTEICFGHSRYSMDSTYAIQIPTNYHADLDRWDHSNSMLPPLPLDTPIKRERLPHHTQNNAASSSSINTTNRISTSPLLSTAQSASHSPSPSPSLSFSSLALNLSVPKLSSSSPSLPPTKQSIHTVSRIHLPLQNSIPSAKATTTTTTIATATAPSSSSSSKRKIHLLTKLGTLFWHSRKSRHQHHPHPYEHQQQRPNRASTPRNHINQKIATAATVQISLPSPLSSTTTSTTNLPSSSQSNTVFTGSSELLPPIPSPTLHFQHHDLYHHHQQQQQPTLTPTTSSLSSSYDAHHFGTRFPPENMMGVVNEDKNKSSSSSDSIHPGMENVPDTCGNGHERTPSWLGRRLSAWMDRAPMLNRSNSGLQQTGLP